MTEELLKLVEQLIEFDYGDHLRLNSISDRLRNGELLYPSDQKYVDMLVSKYLYPQLEEGENSKKPLGSLEKKIQNMKQRYGGDTKPSMGENQTDLCPKCGSTVSKLYSFCSKCGAFHDEHNFIDTPSGQKNNKSSTSQKQSQDSSMKSCMSCNSRIFANHEFCPMCGVHQSDSGLKKYRDRYSKKKNVRKIVISCIIAISVIVAYGSLNIYAISNLEFRGEGTPHFDMASLGADMKLDVCNPTFFPATYSKLGIGIDYKTSNFMTGTIFGGTILPKSSSTVDGRIQLNAASLLGLFLVTFSSALSGEKTNFDPNQLHMTATLDAPLFGIIPFSIEKEYSINEFKNMLGNQTSHFDCK